MDRRSDSEQRSEKDSPNRLSEAETRFVSIVRGAASDVADFSVSIRRIDERYMIVSSLGDEPRFGSGDSFDEAWKRAGI